MDEHIAKNQMRHFSLMNKDRQNLLWNILQGVRWIVTNIILTWKSSKKKQKQKNRRKRNKQISPLLAITMIVFNTKIKFYEICSSGETKRKTEKHRNGDCFPVGITFSDAKIGSMLSELR